ncbi:MAG TPA: NYN domain-containing protein [Trebonia sp.]|nr:NYN domain-containing protein [Trebonia sp.]
MPNQRALTQAVSIQAARDRRLVAIRRRFPARTVHLVDIENLAGAAVPTLREVMDVQVRYARRMALGIDDHVIMASNHLALVNAALGWPHARYRVRSGPDGADLELLDVIECENVAARFTRVVIGSGDGLFGRAAQDLMERGVRVTVVSRWGSLAPSLERAAMEVIYLDSPRRPVAA